MVVLSNGSTVVMFVNLSTVAVLSIFGYYTNKLCKLRRRPQARRPVLILKIHLVQFLSEALRRLH